MAHRKTLKGISRRNLLKVAGAGVLVAGIGTQFCSPSAAKEEPVSTLTSDEALKKLMDGNQRYTDEKRSFPDQTLERREQVAKGQKPFAAILACADSRVPPEILFDQGLGDLFDVRVAGNILEDATLASIEYAVEHLHVPLVMVLGHERCGAVEAALKGGEIPGHISRLVEAIKPAVAKVKGQSGDAVDNAVKANVQLVVEQLKSSQPLVNKLVEKGKLKIVGGRYDLDSGKIEIIA